MRSPPLPEAVILSPASGSITIITLASGETEAPMSRIKTEDDSSATTSFLNRSSIVGALIESCNALRLSEKCQERIVDGRLVLSSTNVKTEPGAVLTFRLSETRPGIPLSEPPHRQIYARTIPGSSPHWYHNQAARRHRERSNENEASWKQR